MDVLKTVFVPFQSDSSGALLLTPSNLNRVLHEAITVKPADTQSIASSTHFTLVNGEYAHA